MEVEGRRRQKAILDELGIRADDTRAPREPTPFELEAAKIDAEDPRGVAGPVVEFDGNIGLVIGAGGGSLTLTDAVRKHGGRPANYAALGGNPSVQEGATPDQAHPLEARRQEDRGDVERGLEHARRPRRARRDQGRHRVGPRPRQDDRHLPRPRAPGKRTRSRSSRSTASSTAIAPSRSARRRSARSRRSGAEGIRSWASSFTRISTFIVQGITGREALNFTRECLQYGSKIVGGVTPGRGGREVYGVPVYDTVREITARRKVDGAVDHRAARLRARRRVRGDRRGHQADRHHHRGDPAQRRIADHRVREPARGPGHRARTASASSCPTSVASAASADPRSTAARRSSRASSASCRARAA